MSKHDEFVRYVLSDMNVARAFFQKFLSHLSDTLDLKNISIQNESFIDEGLKKTMTDLFYQVPWQEQGDLYISLLLEHKSEGAARNGDNLLLQMLFQELQYYKYLMRTQPKRKFPVVVLVGLYHGAKPYSGPRKMADCIEGPPELIRARWHQEEVILIDLADLEENGMEEGRLAVFLRILKHVYDPDIRKCYIELLPSLQKLDGEPSNRSFLVALNNYLLSAAAVENVDEFRDLALKSYSEEVGGALMTMAEVLTQRGFELGLEQGLEQGKEQGSELAALKIASTMLHRGVDIETIADFTGLSIEQIERLVPPSD